MVGTTQQEVWVALYPWRLPNFLCIYQGFLCLMEVGRGAISVGMRADVSLFSYKRVGQLPQQTFDFGSFRPIYQILGNTILFLPVCPIYQASYAR